MLVTERLTQGAIVLGEFVKHRREELKMNQDTLGFAVGRNQKFISRLENNAKELPDPDVMAALARALKCPIDDLLRAAGYAVGEGVDQPHVRRNLMWAGMADDFTPEDNALVTALVEQIRRNKVEK